MILFTLYNLTIPKVNTSTLSDISAQLAGKPPNFKLVSMEGGDIGLFIKQVPKVYNTVFLYVGQITLGTFIEFFYGLYH